MYKIVGFILSFIAIQAQAQIGMNQWRVHFSAYTGQGIANTENFVYMACTNGISYYDLEDNTVNELTFANGLSDLGISAIEAEGNTLAIGYVNGNLDILENNTITNIPWIKLADLSGDKTINSFYFDNNIIYVATNIGLIVFDNSKKEVKDTYYPYLDPTIQDVTILNDTIYLATGKGIYFASKNDSFLNDINNWTKYTSLPTSMLNGPFSEIETFQNHLVICLKSEAFNADSVFFIKDGVMTSYENNPLTVKEINNNDDRLILSLFSSIQTVKEDFSEGDLIFDYPFGTPEPAACLFKNGNYWIADKSNGMVKAINSFAADQIYANSPDTDGSYRIDIQYGKVLVAGGGLTQNFQNNYFRNGVYVFENEEWENFNYKTQENIKFDEDWDFISVAVNQNNTDEFAMGSFSNGGLKIVKDGAQISQVYTSENSVLEDTDGRMVISDLKYDDQGNLWVINKGLEPLKVFLPDGTNYSFSLGSPSKDKYPYRLIIDNDGNKWVAVTNVGLVAFNDNGTIADPSDDQLQTLSSAEGYGKLPSSFVRSIAEDADGEIWIGTEEGLVILYSKGRLYDGGYGDYDVSTINLTVNGEVEKLLGDSYISALTIDGGNRKWIGTNSSGVFCFSEDGSEEIYRFTAENSPLLSNNILDIKIDQLSGEVYFATDKGLVSYRADASLGDSEFNNVSVFPNPVRPDFYGPISVQGLGYESDVTFTDISGNVVYKTVSNGGTVIWDGKNLLGERVQSGVYLVWTGITTGKGKNVAKILFIN